MDWNKYNKVYTIDIGGIEIRKEVTRIDLITTLMNEGELAFKSKTGNFVCDIKNEELRKLLIKNIEEESEKDNKTSSHIQNKDKEVKNGNK